MNTDGLRLMGAAVILMTGACAAPVKDTIETPFAPEGNAARGREVFISREGGHCVLCHAVPGVEVAGNFGPPLAGVAARLTPAEMRLRVADITRVNPDAVMPAFHRAEGLRRVAPEYRGRPVLGPAGGGRGGMALDVEMKRTQFLAAGGAAVAWRRCLRRRSFSPGTSRRCGEDHRRRHAAGAAASRSSCRRSPRMATRCRLRVELASPMSAQDHGPDLRLRRRNPRPHVATFHLDRFGARRDRDARSPRGHAEGDRAGRAFGRRFLMAPADILVTAGACPTRRRCDGAASMVPATVPRRNLEVRVAGAAPDGDRLSPRDLNAPPPPPAGGPDQHRRHDLACR